MPDAIRLVCPECDAVHRVKDITLGKLYRCKKCKSGLITMAPAALLCPSCGATTPPAHIEVSRLITCEECEQAPLMHVKLAGSRAPAIQSSNQALVSEPPEEDPIEEISEPESHHDDPEEQIGLFAKEMSKKHEEDLPITKERRFEPEPVSEETYLEKPAFKADTARIIREVENNHFIPNESQFSEQPTPPSERLFEEPAPEPAYQEDIYEPSHTKEVVANAPQDYQAEELARVAQLQAYEDKRIAENQHERDYTPPTKTTSGVPLWIPTALALLLIGLYGWLLADLDALREKYDESQKALLNKDKAHNTWRERQLKIAEKRELDLKRLKNERDELVLKNQMLKKSLIGMQGPELGIDE